MPRGEDAFDPRQNLSREAVPGSCEGGLADAASQAHSSGGSWGRVASRVTVSKWYR